MHSLGVVGPDPRLRRAYRELADPVMSGWTIERATRERVAALARRGGISGSALIDLMVQHLEVPDALLPRHPLVDPVKSGWRIERATRTRVTTLARRGGITASAFIDLTVQRLDVGLNGLPSWLSTAEKEEGVLPGL